MLQLADVRLRFALLFRKWWFDLSLPKCSPYTWPSLNRFTP